MSRYEELNALLGDRSTKKLAGNTYARRNGDEIVIRYHQTDIGRVSADSVSVDSGGWRTYTTKERLNSFVLPKGLHLWQENGVWFFSFSYNGERAPRFRYADNMTLSHNGEIISGALEETEREKVDAHNKKVKREISRYVKLYSDEILRGYALRIQDGETFRGDCLFCQFGGGEDLGTEHLETHLEENYVMAHLATNAIVSKGYRFPTVILLHGDLARRAIRSYLSKRLLKDLASV